jgi:F-type H+-transporting ATPase subunit gamma
VAATKEIRSKIKSIRSTQKITKAMEMVAASKMRRAQDRMASARPYALKIWQVIGHLANAHPEYRHPFTQSDREVRRVGFIVVSSDGGLAGGLNVNMFRALLSEMRRARDAGLEMDFCLIGAKAIGFFRRLGANVIAQKSQLGAAPKLQDLIGTVKAMLDRYVEGKIDRVYLVFNEFVNSMTQRPRIEQIVPLRPSEEESLKHYWDYLYEPDSKEVLDALLTRYVESLAYQGVVENIACEMAARMVAMKAASDNAGSLIDELQLAYNKARQAAITQEISEIVSGAAAV